MHEVANEPKEGIPEVVFGTTEDSAHIAAAGAAKTGFNDNQRSASDTLTALRAEMDYYASRGLLADGMEELFSDEAGQGVEKGAVLICRHQGRIRAAAFFHVTWKGNMFLDWLSATPEGLGGGYGKMTLAKVLACAEEIDAELLFIESKKGSASFYQGQLKFKGESRDFILLSRGVDGWREVLDK